MGGNAVKTLIGGAALVFTGGALGWSFLVTAGRSLVWSAILGAVSKATSKKPSTAGATMAAQGRLETVRQALGPRQVVYGRARVGGTLTFFETTTDNQTALMIVTLTGHPVQAIRDVYYNDASTLDYAVGGAGGAATGKFGGYSTVYRSYGTEGASQPFADLVARGLSWTSAHLQRDCAKVHTTHTFSNDVWQTGLPQVSAVIDGVKDIYDPRLGSPTTNRWSNNPALCIAHYLTASYGLDADYTTEIDETALIAAANICDERVTLSGNQTAEIASVSDSNDWIQLTTASPHVQHGDGIRFSPSSPGSLPGGLTEGTTYYAIPMYEGDTTTGQILRVATSYANAMAGTYATLSSDAGSGTTTVTFYDEPRYRLNGAFSLNEKPQAILERMLAAMAGKLVNTGGVWYIYAGAYTAPTLTFDEDDFAGPIELQTNVSRRESCNAIKGTFVDPSNRWQPVDFPPITSATYLAEDGGERVFRDLDLTAFVTSGTQAQRLAKIDLITTRLGLSFRARFKLSAFRMLTGTVVSITNTQLGWSSKAFEVINCTLVIEQDGRLEVDATLRETASAVYDWSVSDEQLATIAPNTNLPDPSTVAVPTALTFAQSSTVPNRADLSWTAPSDAFVDTYQLEWADSGSPTVWNVMPPTRDTALSIDGLDLGAYQFRVKGINVFGSASDYATTTGSMTAPDIADVTGLVIYGTSGSPTVTEFTGKDCTVQWDHVASGSAGYFFKDYEVSVYRAGSPTTLLRTEYTANPWYTYTFEKNYKDTSGTPVRAFRFEVKRRGFYNQVSDVAAQLEVSNTAPTITGFVLTAADDAFQFSYTVSDPDFVGVKVYTSLESGFTPGSTNLGYEGGKKNGFVGPLIGGMKYYVKYVPVDAFGDGSTSSEYSVTVARPIGSSLGADFGLGSLYETAAVSLNTAYSWVRASSPVYVPSTGLIYCFGAVNTTNVLELAAFDARTLELVKRVTLSPDWTPGNEIYLTGQPVYSPDTGKIYAPILDNTAPASYLYEIDPATLSKTASYSTGTYYLLRGVYCSSNSKIYWLAGNGISKIIAFDPVGSPTEYVVSAATPSGSMCEKSILYIPTVDRLAIADAQYIYFLSTAMVETGSPQERINLTNTVGAMAYCSRNDRIYAAHDAGSNDIKVVSSGLGLVATITGPTGLGAFLFYSPQNGALYVPRSAGTDVVSTETNTYAGTLSAVQAGYGTYGEKVPIAIPDMYSMCLMDTGPRLELHAL